MNSIPGRSWGEWLPVFVTSAAFLIVFTFAALCVPLRWVRPAAGEE